MSRFSTSLFMAALCLLLGGCGARLASKSLPQWVLEPESAYSSSQYLTSIGEGDTLRSAETHALRRLAGRFKTRVQSTERLSDRVQETFGAAEAYEKKSAYQSDTRLETDQTLLNVRTAEQYRDKTGRVYALIVLDRLETSRLYEQSIIDNAQRIALLTKTNPSKLASYASTQLALKLGLKNKMLLDQLAIIHPKSAQQLGLPYGLDQLRSQAAEATGMIRFKVDLEGDRSGPLAGQIRAWMTARGFKASSVCDLCITGSLSIESMDFLREDLRTVRYYLLVNMKDAKAQTLLAMQKEGRESHITVEQAYRRAERTVQQFVEKELSDRLEMLIENLSGGS